MGDTVPYRITLSPVAEQLLRNRPFVEIARPVPSSGGADPLRTLNCQVLVFGRHGKETAILDEPRPVELCFDVSRKAFENGMIKRRPDDPGMEHAVRTEIVDEPPGARHDSAHVKRLDAGNT